MNPMEVMDLTTVCSSFPNLSVNPIIRENILNTIDTILGGETELLIIEGEDGIGKTTILAQFAQRYPNTTLSLFVKPTSRWGYDPDILLRDLSEQLTWLLDGRELSPEELVDQSYFRNCVLRLQKKTRTRKTRYVFILDGVYEIPDGNIEIQNQILNLLPLGLYGFIFLISGNSNQFNKLLLSKIPYKSFPIPGFTLEETKIYLSKLNIDEHIREIYQTCKGVPIHLTSTNGFWTWELVIFRFLLMICRANYQNYSKLNGKV